MVEELHENEQYFFDAATLDELATMFAAFERPCVLCAPMLGRVLAERKVDVRILDIDRRFADVPGFIYWDVHRPTRLNEQFDAIFCDPPFFNVSLSRLFRAIRVLARFDFAQPLAITHLARRSSAIEGTFAPFSLAPAGYHPGYQTVKRCEKNEVEVFANFALST